MRDELKAQLSACLSRSLGYTYGDVAEHILFICEQLMVPKSHIIVKNDDGTFECLHSWNEKNEVNKQD